MSSIVRQKVGNNIYLYESVSYRNEDGKPRNKRVQDRGRTCIQSCKKDLWTWFNSHQITRNITYIHSVIHICDEPVPGIITLFFGFFHNHIKII